MSLPPRPPLNYYDGDLPMSINEFYTKYINDSSVTFLDYSLDKIQSL